MEHTSLDNLIREFTVANRAAGLSEKTISWYLSFLREYQAFVKQRAVQECTVASLRLFFAELQDRKPYSEHPVRPTVESRSLSTETILGYGRSLKRFCNWLVEEGYLEKSPMARVRLPRRPKHTPKDVSQEKIQALLQAAATSRDKAIILFLASTGVRASELCTVVLDKVDMEDRITIVRGKGSKDRFIFFDQHTANAIRAWLKERPDTNTSYLFTTYQGEPLSVAGLQQVLRRLTKRAGISTPINPHRFRHAFAKHWMMNGGDEFSLATILGHEDIATTRIYSQYRVRELQEKYARIVDGH